MAISTFNLKGKIDIDVYLSVLTIIFFDYWFLLLLEEETII